MTDDNVTIGRMMRDALGLDEIRKDAERFRWYMSDAPKPPTAINDYLTGVREHWTLDQWRAWCDKWMQA